MCIIGHSLVDIRQKLFCEELRRQELDVLEIFPKKWHHQERSGGYDVEYEGNMAAFVFDLSARQSIKEFQPDIIYCMQEWWCRQARQSQMWAHVLGCKFSLFLWENIHKPNQLDIELLKRTDLIVCGNREAEEIVREHNPNTCRLPQVGIDTDLFRPMPEIEKEFDLVFVGRDLPEKGTQVIREAIDGLVTSRNIKILWRKEFLNYDQLPQFFNRAKIHLSPSIDQPWWHEQAGNYSNVEALLCGLSVVTSNSAAMVEWLDGCPSVIFVSQNDPAALREAILQIEKHGGGREWIIDKYSNEVVARQLIKAFEGMA